MEKKPALIQFPSLLLRDLDRYALEKGVSRNSIVNIACSNLLGETELLKSEIVRLQKLLVNLAMSR